MRRHTLTMVTSSLPLRYSLSVYSALWPPLSIRMLPTIVRSGRLTETPDQLSVFSPPKLLIAVLFIAAKRFAAGSVVLDVYNLVGYHQLS
jgi:hypothetical protein